MISPRLRWLFDTDHVSLQERGHAGLKAKLEEAPPQSIAVCVVTAEEMIRGRLALPAKRTPGEKRVHASRKFLETIQFFGAIQVIPFDLACEKKFQELQALARRIGSQDLKIAATALVNDLVLVSRNRRDFEQVPALRLEDWSVE